MQHYRKKSGTDSFKTRRYSSPLYFTLSRFYQKQMFSNMLPNINVTKRHNSVSIQQVRSYVHPINQKTKWIGGKGFDEEETVKKYF